MLDAAGNIILDRGSDFTLYVRDPDGGAMALGLEIEVSGLFELAPVADTVTLGLAASTLTEAHAPRSPINEVATLSFK